jgi:hypothetical protein
MATLIGRMPDGLLVMLVLLGACVATGLVITAACYLWARYPPRRPEPEVDAPRCHCCARPLKPVAAKLLSGQAEGYDDGSPEGATWFCNTCHDGPIYYAETPRAAEKPAGIKEL